jgi:CBS domain-containing protein
MTARRLPVRSCRVIGAAAEVRTHQTVQCPRRQQATALERCCGCAHMKAFDVEPDGKSGVVECLAGDGLDMPRGRVDVAEAAIRVRVGDVLGIETTCVRGNLSAIAVAELLVTKGLRAVPVVDDTRRLIGIVSKSDLLRKTSVRRRPRTAADIMTPVVHGLPEDAPVAYAISLMAFEGLHEVPIVDGKGQVLGMITATETLRWVAQALGYVVPGSMSVPRA